MPAPLLVFDLDGTLVDTAPDLIAVLNRILVQEGLATVSLAHARVHVSGGIARLLGETYREQNRTLDAATLARLTPQFLDEYKACMTDLSHPFAHVVTAMDILAESGWRFAICTNKLEELAKPLIEDLGLSSYFAAIAGRDTFGVMKPDAGHLLKTIAAAGGTPEASVMIGDSSADIDVARHAGVPSIAVTFGYSDKPVEALGADALLTDYRALPDLAASLLTSPAAI